MVRLLFFATLSLAVLSGCAANSYMGIRLSPGAANPAIQMLARQAMAGDKHAQMKLGSYYQSASDGIIAVDQNAVSDSARMEDIENANAIFQTSISSKDLRRYRSWRMLAMTRARELYKNASTDSGGESLPEAGRLLSSIDDAIFREQFVTRFNDPNDEVCQDHYTYADWQRDAQFIVEGKLTHRFVRQSKRLEGESWVHWEDRHYEAEIEITRFIKWPDKFPRPQTMAFSGEIVEGQLVDENTGDRRGCRTWGPDRGTDETNAIVILQYHNSAVRKGEFEIVRTIEIDPGGYCDAADVV